MKTWILGGTAGVVGALIVAALWWGVRVLRRGETGPARLGHLVLDTFGDDWAKRLGREPREVRAVVLGDADPAVARSLHDLVGEVDVRFDRLAGAAAVGSTMLCVYPDDRATAELRLPWEDTPADVRAEFLRDGAATVTRRWTVPVR